MSYLFRRRLLQCLDGRGAVAPDPAVLRRALLVIDRPGMFVGCRPARVTLLRTKPAASVPRSNRRAPRPVATTVTPQVVRQRNRPYHARRK